MFHTKTMRHDNATYPSHSACLQLVNSVTSYAQLGYKPSPNLFFSSDSLFQSVVTLIALPWQILLPGRHSLTLNDEKRPNEEKGLSERKDEKRTVGGV